MRLCIPTGRYHLWVLSSGGVLMLVLSRRPGQEIVIDGDIRLIIVAVNGNQVRIGIAAPLTVVVDRLEVRLRRAERATSESPTIGEVG